MSEFSDYMTELLGPRIPGAITRCPNCSKLLIAGQTCTCGTHTRP